jgi:hypothetical protein
MWRVLVGVLLLAGCAGGDVTDVSGRVEAYSSAFLEGRGGAAWEMLSVRCQDVLDEGEFVATVVAAGELYGPQEVEVTQVDVDGGVASVSYGYPDASGLDQVGQRWVSEGDRWVYDDC